jgi:hypothetical protein
MRKIADYKKIRGYYQVFLIFSKILVSLISYETHYLSYKIIFITPKLQNSNFLFEFNR